MRCRIKQPKRENAAVCSRLEVNAFCSPWISPCLFLYYYGESRIPLRRLKFRHFVRNFWPCLQGSIFPFSFPFKLMICLCVYQLLTSKNMPIIQLYGLPITLSITSNRICKTVQTKPPFGLYEIKRMVPDTKTTRHWSFISDPMFLVLPKISYSLPVYPPCLNFILCSSSFADVINAVLYPML